MNKQDLEEFIDYIYDDKIFLITREKLNELASDYLNDLHTEMCENKQYRESTQFDLFEDE